MPADWSRLTVGGGLTWQGSTYTSATTPSGTLGRIEQGSYALVNLMARYEISRQLSVQLNIDNLFYETHYAMFEAFDQQTFGAPRSGMLSLRYRF